MKLKPKFFLKLIITISLFFFLFSKIDLSKITANIHKLSLPFIVFALLYYTGCQWLSCLRWKTILRPTGHLIPIKSLFSFYFTGMFVNIFLPGAFGGDVYRIYRVSETIKDPEVAISSVFLERFTGLAAIFGLGLMGLPVAFKIIGRWDIILLFLVCLTTISGGFLLIISPRLLIWVEPWLEKFKLSKIAASIAKIQIIFRKFLHHPQALFLAIGISFVLQLCIVNYLYLIAQQLEIPISYLHILVFMPISVVVTLLPISLGGLGVQEGLWAYMFSRVGLPPEQAVLLTLTFTFLGWTLSLFGGVIFLLDSTVKKDIIKNKKN